MNAPAITATAESFEELGSILEGIRAYSIKVAAETLREVQAQSPAMKNPVVLVDGKKKPITDVKIFGTITILAQYGPVREAVQLATEYVAQACGGFKHPSGFYQRLFAWYMNGDLVSEGTPDVARMGKLGNVQLVNAAGYAAMPEIFLPDAVIYGAYKRLAREFGDRLALSFSYGPAHAFGQVWPERRKSKPFLAVPVLTIGHPSANFKRRGTRPGVRIRARRRAAAKAAKAGAA